MSTPTVTDRSVTVTLNLARMRLLLYVTAVEGALAVLLLVVLLLRGG